LLFLGFFWSEVTYFTPQRGQVGGIPACHGNAAGDATLRPIVLSRTWASRPHVETQSSLDLAFSRAVSRPHA